MQHVCRHRLRATPALTQYRDAVAAPEAEGAGTRRTVSVSLADMPCMCQADVQPSLADVAAEAFIELGVTKAAERAASARRLLLNGKPGRADAAVRIGDTVELLPVELPTAVPVMSERVVAAEESALDGYDAATLREFVAEAQRALAGGPASLVVKVNQCGDLAEFLRARPALERSANGVLTATVASFLEPQWSRAEHLSNAGAPLLFERDDIERAFAEEVHAAPALALKLIRREATEEMLAGVAPSEDAVGSGPAGGDNDAARRMNERAFAWAHDRLPGAADASASRRDSVVAADDRVLGMEGATTQFVQSRVELTKVDGGRLAVRSPSLVTPISGPRAAGSGSHFCKVLPPGSALRVLLALCGDDRS